MSTGARLALKDGRWQPLFLKLHARGASVEIAARLVGVTLRQVHRERQTSERFNEDFQTAGLCAVAHRRGHRIQPRIAQRVAHAAVDAGERPMALMLRLLAHADRIRAGREAGLDVRQPWHPRPARHTGR